MMLSHFRIGIGSEGLLTSCSKCGARYELPDKLLGRQGRCKACNTLFVITPVEEAEVELPMPTGSTAQLRPVSRREASRSGSNPLDALANAASESGSNMRPARSSSRVSYGYVDDEEDDERPPSRMAKGATLAMALGIASLLLAVAGTVTGSIAAVKADDEQLLITLGSIGIGLAALGTILAMVGIVSGNSASRTIRKARHRIGGRTQASVGTLTGMLALGLIVIAFVGGAIWLSRRGGITFQKQLGPDGKPLVEPGNTPPPGDTPPDTTPPAQPPK